MLKATADFIPIQCIQDGVNTIPEDWAFDPLRNGYAPNEVIEEGYNPSGITPTEYKILVLPDDIPEKTAGGILVPFYARDQRQGACQTGVVIDIADEAFSFIEGEGVRRPVIGERVAYTKYAGMLLRGKDAKHYKLMNDKDVAAVLDFPFDPKDYQF